MLVEMCLTKDLGPGISTYHDFILTGLLKFFFFFGLKLYLPLNYLLFLSFPFQAPFKASSSQLIPPYLE